MTHAFWWDVATPFLILIAFPAVALRNALRYGISSARERGNCWTWLAIALAQCFVQCALLVQHGAVAAAWAGGIIAAAIIAVSIAAVLRARRDERIGEAGAR